jgi:regulator of nonsense transcripts 1
MSVFLSPQIGYSKSVDQSFYRTHDALGYIPSDVQSLRSQANYSSGLPMFATNGPFGAGVQRGPAAKRGPYGSYASSIISQEGPIGTDSSSVVGSSVGTSDRRSTNMAYSQSD